jgi:hypothetical protein
LESVDSGIYLARKEEVLTYLMHETTGRLRIKIPELKKRPTEAERLRSLLTQVEGVRTATVNPITGSLIVTFDHTTVRPGTIIEILFREKYLDPRLGIHSEDHLSQAVTNVGHAASKALVGLLVNRALQGTPLAFLSALL